MAMIWVSPETALKMQHSGEGIKLIRPSYWKWEQKWSDSIQSFVFFGQFLCIYKIAWPLQKKAQKNLKFFLVASEVYVQP